MPLGGEEINSGYKGYGLGMLVDILCGIMSGSNYGPNIRHWNNYVGQVANLGHFFLALDPDYFAPDFKDRLQVSFSQNSEVFLDLFSPSNFFKLEIYHQDKFY